MTPGSPHLDLEAVIAEVSGEAVDNRARAHLAGCPGCRAEARRWAAAARGVRHLVAAASSASGLPGSAVAGSEQARPAAWWRGGPRALAAGLPRRVLVAAVAATVVVAGGACYGLTAALSGSGSSPAVSAAAGLTAVSGCPGRAATSGTLEQVKGTSLVIKAIRTGRRVTVTTSASTQINRQVTGSVGDITGGSQVIVHGTGSRGTLAAGQVTIGVELRKPPGYHGNPHVRGGSPAAGGIAAGTVTDAGAAGFTVIMPGGVRIPVATSASTTVYTLKGTSLSRLRIGGFTAAAGRAGRPGRLAAATVDQGAHLPRISPRQPGGAGCSPAAVAAALLATG
jgi:hypothetical protein